MSFATVEVQVRMATVCREVQVGVHRCCTRGTGPCLDPLTNDTLSSFHNSTLQPTADSERLTLAGVRAAKSLVILVHALPAE
jgi:hypothetical protein